MRGICPIDIHVDHDKSISDVIGRQTFMLSLDFCNLNFSLTCTEDDDGNACRRTRGKNEKSGEEGREGVKEGKKGPSLVIYQML